VCGVPAKPEASAFFAEGRGSMDATRRRRADWSPWRCLIREASAPGPSTGIPLRMATAAPALGSTTPMVPSRRAPCAPGPATAERRARGDVGTDRSQPSEGGRGCAYRQDS
jgi:hypothetical protein